MPQTVCGAWNLFRAVLRLNPDVQRLKLPQFFAASMIPGVIMPHPAGTKTRMSEYNISAAEFERKELPI